ncbi:MAG: elongation factor G [candidate division Zixibacteria bacterium 4484_93]|nr:MAG: elongation factor G [candidate division Zixibacteria bacterium 4484_93]
MKEYATEDIRNVMLASHSGTGKTTLVEAMLNASGVISRIGSVEQGNTVSDYHPNEIERGNSIYLSFMHIDWNGKKINIVDAPGFTDFVGEVIAGFRAVDLVLLPVSAQAGVEVGTEIIWEYLTQRCVPAFFFVNKCDKEHSDFASALKSIQDSSGDKAVAFSVPINEGEGLSGVVDILRKKAYSFDEQGKRTEIEIPDSVDVESLHETIVERIAESDDLLLEKYLETMELSDEEILSGLKKAILARDIYPVFAGSAVRNIGVTQMLELISEAAPAPSDLPAVRGRSSSDVEELDTERHFSVDEPTSLFVFKTLAEAHVGEIAVFRLISGRLTPGVDLLNPGKNFTERLGQLLVANGRKREDVLSLCAGDIGMLVKLKNTVTGDTLCDGRAPIVYPAIEFPPPLITEAIKPTKKGEEDKVAMGLSRLHDEDPTFLFHVDPELKQTIIEGQGEIHLDTVVQKLKERFGVEVELTRPRIHYRETIKKKAEAQGKYKKQTGGHGQYGDVHLRLEPLPRGGGFEFLDEIVGGVVPSRFIPAVEKGVRETMAAGVLAGYKVVDVRVALFYGSYHPVDSSEVAFKVAASMGFKKAFMEADPVILEPINDVTVIVPDEFMGDVMGDLSSRRGKIVGMEPHGAFQRIKAYVPAAEMYRYSISLRAMTQGRGIFQMRFSHYEEAPPDVMQKIIAEAQIEKEGK